MTPVKSISHQHFASVGSTNDLALDAFRKGRREALWITADEQVLGKGRRGRGWVSPPGNFYGSLLLVDPAASETLPQMAFVISLALHKALSRALPPTVQTRLTVKWPNDLLYDRKKVAGILMEATQLQSHTGIVIFRCRPYSSCSAPKLPSLWRAGRPVRNSRPFVRTGSTGPAELANRLPCG
mgnify:CR=1 FL=1